MRWTVGLEAKLGRVPTMPLRELVAAANDTGKNAASDLMHSKEAFPFIRSYRSGNELLWSFTAGRRAAWFEANDMLVRVARVVELQLADLSDPRAGASLVPDEIYYNAAHDPQFRAPKGGEKGTGIK